MPNKNYFAQLSLKQKAELFNIYARGGYTSLSEIENHYNSLFNDDVEPVISIPESDNKEVVETLENNYNEQSFELPTLADYFYENPNRFDDGGDKGNELKNNVILKRAKDEDVSLLSARKDAMSKMFDVTDYIASGLASYYPYYTNTYGFPQSTFYTDASGRVYEYPGGEFYDMAAAAGLKHLPFTDLQKRLPKRDYIGGNGYELRIAQMIPGFVEEVKRRAESYGLNPNLMMRRLIKEGFLRHQATMYNGAISTSDQKDYFRNFDWDAPIQGYGLMGLDYAGDNLLEGRYELKDKNATWTDAGPWKDSEAGGRTGNHRIIPDNMKSALEILAAELAFRREEVKRLYNPSDEDLDAYTNASFNYGLRGKIFKDRDKLVSEYGDYPDYYGQLKESEKSKN